MKKTILALTLTALTLGAFAGEACCPKNAKNKAACADQNKAACAEKIAAGCPVKKSQCPTGGTTARAAGKRIQSPKDAGNS